VNYHKERADLLRSAVRAQRQLEHDGSSGVSGSTDRDQLASAPEADDRLELALSRIQEGVRRSNPRDRRAGSGYWRTLACSR